MNEEKKRPELFLHSVDPYLAVEEAESFFEKGDIEMAEKALVTIMAEFYHEMAQSKYGKNPPIFNYHPKVWTIFAKISEKKGDEQNQIIGNGMAITTEFQVEETKMVAEKEFADISRGEHTAENWFKAAVSLEQKELAAEVLYCLMEAYKLDEKNEEIARNLQIRLVNARLYRIAEGVAKKTISNGGEDIIYKETLAIALLCQKKYEETIPILQELTELNPTNGKRWHLLSTAYGNLGRNRDAAGALRKLIDLNYEAEYARKILKEIESVEVARHMGYSFSVATAASVEKSDDDSVITQEDHMIMKMILNNGAVSEETGFGPIGGEGNSWIDAVMENLVSKGFAIFTKSRMAYLTEKGIKRLEET